MVLKVVWTKRAYNNFEKTIDYLNENWSLNVSKEFAYKVFSSIDTIKFFPRIGKLENKERLILGLVISKNTSIFYRFDSEFLYILNVFDNRLSPNKRV